jgi:opacity protein-like surface antigen
MRIRASCSIGVLLVLVMSGSARAQDDRRIHVNFGGGPTFNFGEIGERFSTGWGPAVGVEVVVNPRIGVQFEYAYRWFQVKDEIDIQAGRFSANHQTHQLAFNVITRLTSPDSPVRVYFTAGPGMYHRGVDITEYEGNGVICDPWLYLCGTYPIESIRASRNSWDFGFNVGGGVGLPIGEGLEFYIETRYHHVWGPEFTPPVGFPTPTSTTESKANGQYWPLTFGFRF